MFRWQMTDHRTRIAAVALGVVVLVAFAGEFRAFSHRAVHQFFGNDVDVESAPSFRGVFDRVCSGQADFGVLPLENSLTGSIHQNYDLLLEMEVRIVGERARP